MEGQEKEQSLNDICADREKVKVGEVKERMTERNKEGEGGQKKCSYICLN